MTPLVALLTLLAAPDRAAPAGHVGPVGPVGVDGYEAVEHVALPELEGPLELRVRSLERLVVLTAPRGSATVARAAQRAPRAICTGVEQAGVEVRLRCRSSRIVARLVKRPGGTLLEIGEGRGLPWSGEDAPPLLAFDPHALGLGDPCPGSTPGGRAECLIGRGDLDGARAQLAGGGEGLTAGHAALRLGDLALVGGDPHAAATHWSHARGAPWERMAATRLCELSAACVAAPGADALFALDDLPAPLARELVLRRARALAFVNRPLDGLRGLLSSAVDATACSSAPATCQRIALLALALPGAAGVEALTLWLDLPSRDVGPAAYPAEVAAAELAAREGAPAFGANVLAAAAARVPALRLGEHLLRAAELYLAAGDRVRAGVVVDFARARAGHRALAGSRWAAVQRALGPQRPRRALAARLPDPSEVELLVGAAGRAAQSARDATARGAL